MNTVLKWIGVATLVVLGAWIIFTLGRATSPSEKVAEKPPGETPTTSYERKITALENQLAEAKKASPAPKPDTCTSVTLANGQVVKFEGVPEGECVTKNMLSPKAQCPSGRAALEPRGKVKNGDNRWHVKCLA